MLITAIEGRISLERVSDLEEAYRESLESLPSGIVETFLARDVMDPSLVRIVTVWASREAMMDTVRASSEKPKGIQMLEAVGAEHRHSASEVLLHQRR
jgi:heme-degrading monooxygenase HmoA